MHARVPRGVLGEAEGAHVRWKEALSGQGASNQTGEAIRENTEKCPLVKVSPFPRRAARALRSLERIPVQEGRGCGKQQSLGVESTVRESRLCLCVGSALPVPLYPTCACGEKSPGIQRLWCWDGGPCGLGYHGVEMIVQVLGGH